MGTQYELRDPPSDGISDLCFIDNNLLLVSSWDAVCNFFEFYFFSSHFLPRLLLYMTHKWERENTPIIIKQLFWRVAALIAFMDIGLSGKF